MNADQILIEIRETNLSYLTLAQSLIRADRDQAMFRLGLSEAAADRLASLTPDQVLKVASSNTLVCRMRVDDDLVWGLLTSHGKGAGSEGYARLQAAFAASRNQSEAA
jgi:flagellar transcriptional activator FlhD